MRSRAVDGATARRQFPGGADSVHAVEQRTAASAVAGRRVRAKPGALGLAFEI